MKSTHLLWLWPIVVAACLALDDAVHAEIIIYDNSAETFSWGGISMAGPIGTQLYLDVTMPPTQSGAFTPRCITRWLASPQFSATCAAPYFVALDGISPPVANSTVLAINPDVDLPFDCTTHPDILFVHPAWIFLTGQSVGAAEATWSRQAAYEHVCFSFCGIGPLFADLSRIGLKFQMPDGLHYGWLQYRHSAPYAMKWAWETTPNTPIEVPPLCGAAASVADLNGDGSVNALDLGILLSAWSIPATAAGCQGAQPCCSDLNGDGVVNTLDLGILLSAWTLR